MKKLRMYFGLAALLFSFASAFALKSTPLADDPARVIDGQCERVSASCNGTVNDCLQTGTSNVVQQFQAGQTCGNVLKMGNP